MLPSASTFFSIPCDSCRSDGNCVSFIVAMCVHVFVCIWCVHIVCVSHNLSSPPPLPLQPSAFTLSQKTTQWPRKAFVPCQKARLSWKVYSCRPSEKVLSPQEDFGHSKRQWLVRALKNRPTFGGTPQNPGFPFLFPTCRCPLQLAPVVARTGVHHHNESYHLSDGGCLGCGGRGAPPPAGNAASAPCREATAQ